MLFDPISKRKEVKNMTEDRKVFDIGTVPFVEEFTLVALPSLITVQSIKRAFVNQMTEPPLKMLKEHGDKEFRIVGRVGPYVVFHSDSQQFVKIHRSEFTDYVQSVLIQTSPRTDPPDVKTLQREALKKFNEIPQIFEG